MQGFAQEEMFRLDPLFERQTDPIGPHAREPAWCRAEWLRPIHPDPTLPRAVIFHDSFFNEMIPFLSDHFSWAIYHWAFKVDETLIAGEKPDVVIFEVTDRYLSRLLDFNQKVIEDQNRSALDEYFCDR